MKTLRKINYMKYFAELDENKKVIRTFIVPKEIFDADGMSLESMNENIFNPSHTIIEYSEDTSVTMNRAEVNYTYDSNLNAFIPPKLYYSYNLNTQTFEWEPDGNILYDLHGDGNLYAYNHFIKGWQITESQDDKIIINLSNDKIEPKQISLTDTL